MKNQQLSSIADQIKAKLKPDLQDAFERIVVAGMEFLYADDATHELAMRHIEEAADVPTAVGEGIASVMVMLGQKSNNTMPWDAGIAAGYALVCEALDFLEQKGSIQVDGGVIEAAMQAYVEQVLGLLGISNDQVSQLTAKAQASQGAQAPGGEPSAMPVDAAQPPMMGA